ncbi:hypothetical protein HPB49_003690 [Dermacentor silvarum]|uniref:Uncharacterized protein n=1 Tax=Dermacentor silvarum TaxID=543639 RepID=A0ACB8DTU0_DERSI|nr:hypothetical protein HPB49_003690 [Dermacentor silvarum]
MHRKIGDSLLLPILLRGGFCRPKAVNPASQTGTLSGRPEPSPLSPVPNTLWKIGSHPCCKTITYVTPYLHLNATDKLKLNTIIERAYKQALQLPIFTSNEKLDALGLHNIIDELIESQRITQHERLANSTTGGHILRTLGITYTTQFGPKVPVPPNIRAQLVTSPIPRNMHPEHNQERRADRAKHLQKRYAQAADGAYVDTAEYPHQNAIAVAVVMGWDA